MDIEIIVVHFLISILFFMLINWLGNKSISFGYAQLSVFYRKDPAPAFNFTFRVLTPIVFLLIISTIFYSLHLDKFINNIYLVIIYYFIIRLIVILVLERLKLINWNTFGSQIIITIILSLLSYKWLILKRNILFPDVNTLGNELWLLIIVFVYSLINKMQVTNKNSIQRKRNYIRIRYLKYNNKYSWVINKYIKNGKLEALIYSIMIIETFNRPTILRSVERFLLLFGREKSIGIMQIKSKKYISDNESIKTGINRINATLKEAIRIVQIRANKNKLRLELFKMGFPNYLENEIIHEALVKYNYSGDYARDVEELLRILLSDYYPNCIETLANYSIRNKKIKIQLTPK